MARVQTGEQRIAALDGLRGLAAATVAIGHGLDVFPTVWLASNHGPAAGALGWLTYSPLHLLWAGHEAVILFFVLSGFVLAFATMMGRLYRGANTRGTRECSG